MFSHQTHFSDHLPGYLHLGLGVHYTAPRRVPNVYKRQKYFIVKLDLSSVPFRGV